VSTPHDDPNADGSMAHDPRELLLDGETPQPLPAEDTCWRVCEGRVEVYLQTARVRRLVAIVGAGGLVFPLPASAASGNARILLASSSTARLEPGAVPTRAAALQWLAESGQDGSGSAATALPEDDAALLAAVLAFNASLVRRVNQDAIARDRATALRLQLRDDAGSTSAGVAAELRWLAEQLGATVPEFGQDEDEGAPRASDLFDDAPATPPPPFEGLAARVRRHGLRARPVNLGAHWPMYDGGSLLLLDQGGRLVAAHWSGDRYRLRDGTALGAGAASEYAHEAWSLHAPFGTRLRGLWSLAGFTLADLRPELRPYLVATLALALAGLALPIATGAVFEDLVPAGAAGQLAATGIALVALAVFEALFHAIQNLVHARVDGRGSLRLAAALDDHVLRLPARFFRTLPAGDFNQRLESLAHLRELVGSTVLTSLYTTALAVTYFALLFTYDARLAATGLALTAVHIGILVLGRVVQRAPLREAAAHDGRLAGMTYELLEGIAKLRTGAAEDRALARWTDLYVDERAASARGERIGLVFHAFGDAYGTLRLMVLFAAAVALARSDLPPGAFIAFLTGFGLFQAAFTQLCQDLLALYAAQPLAERAQPILDAETEDAGGARNLDPGRLSGAIELSGVVFGYSSATAPLIDGLSFSVAPGEHLAIVGGSGSGKSTVLRLLLGFETPSAGSIAYDGRELAHLDLARVRSQIGVVLQSSMLFSGTILENIRGASDASLEDCLDAAELAGLGPDLKLMGMGVHTPITEGGGSFSGGQKQRILIARALAAKPRILFLDEATSALDNITQAHVARTMDGLRATRITIAHRLSTVQQADRICVLQHGRFVESGSYAELMAQGGHFAALARRQLLQE
jgi:NHLM bacteriocin system ABC transporter ATP-binding protein